MEQILDFIRQLLEGIWNFLGNTLNGFFEWVNQAIIWLINGLGFWVQMFAEGIAWIINGFGAIIEWFIAGVNFILNALWFAVMFIWQMLEMLYHFAVAVISNVDDVIRIIDLLLQLVVGAARVIFTYIPQAVSIFFSILSSLNDAPVQQIPGLPRCISAPLDHQSCALWYVFDNTLFAPSTPGVHLVPLVVLIIDLVIVIYIVRVVFKLIKSFDRTVETV
jgi:hypothetical protein